MFGLLGSHLDLSEHIIMAIRCRLIHIWDAVANKKVCSYANVLESSFEREFLFMQS